MSDARGALAVLRDYVERSTHWTEGGATRHEALAALEKMADADESLLASTLLVAQALSYVDSIREAKQQEVSYETMQRARFNRPEGWRRKYTMRDARIDAGAAAILLREAWQKLDPI